MVDRGLDANLSFIGYAQEEAYLNKMKEWIEKLQLSNRVQILPKNTDKKEQFSKTDIFLLPSRSEGLPLTLLEAQAAGVRSVASDVISKDVNLGGVAFAKLNDFSDWIKKVEEFISRNETLNVDVSKVEQKQWCQKIRVFYEMR